MDDLTKFLLVGCLSCIILIGIIYAVYNLDKKYNLFQTQKPVFDYKDLPIMKPKAEAVSQFKKLRYIGWLAVIIATFLTKSCLTNS